MVMKGEDIHGAGDDLLIIGPPKTGKTRMLGTVYTHKKLYILSLENGLSTIAGAKFDYDECGDWDEFNAKLSWFMTNYKKEGYTALGIDSFSRMQRYLSDHILKRDQSKKLSFDQFAEVLAITRNLANILTKNNDFASIVLCHQELGQDGNYYPSLEGNIKYELSGYFDTVVHSKCGLDTKGKPSYWCTLNGGGVGGTRLRHLREKTIIKNDYAELIAK